MEKGSKWSRNIVSVFFANVRIFQEAMAPLPLLSDYFVFDRNPIHMAILGGNLDVVRWLISERCCPLLSRDIEQSILTTSKGRTPIQLALTHSNPEILRFLVVEQGLSLMGEDLRGDYRYLLVHLTKLLETVPDSLLQQDNDSNSDHSSSVFEQLNASLPNFGRSATVEEKALVTKDPKDRRGSF